jgi:hypothetical protein
MPIDPNGVFETISHAISKFPPALFAAALLGGPTLIWLIVRFASPPAPRKRADLAGQELLWVCGGCRSINDDWLVRCYSCQRPRAADLIPVVSDEWDEDAGYESDEIPPGVGVPVGPGLPAVLPTASSWLGAGVRRASDATGKRHPPDPQPEPEPELVDEMEFESELELEPELDVAVGSDMTQRVFEPVVIEPRLRVSARVPRSASRSEPRSETRTGLRATTRPAPRGRWTDLPPPEAAQAEAPEAADEEIPKRRAGGRRSAGG